jgi:toxin ParE1/3/4
VTRRVVILAAARRDLREQRDYIARDSVATAQRFLNAADEAFQQLAAMPSMGARKQVRNRRLAGLRQWSIHGFERSLIYYRETAAGIEVIRVLHGARDIDRILEAE